MPATTGRVGLLPAGGGLKEIALRASEAAGPKGDVFAELKRTFETVAMAKVSSSAVEAKELGLLRDDDVVVLYREAVVEVQWRPLVQRDDEHSKRDESDDDAANLHRNYENGHLRRLPR